MSLFFRTLVNGLLVGGLYVTISIGFSLAFGVLDVVDFAVGEWVMLGAFAGVAWQSWFDVDPFAALPVVFVVFAGVGALLAPLIYRVRTSQYARPALMALAFTFGVATLARGTILTAVGFDPRTVHTSFAEGTLSLIGLEIPWLRLVDFIFAVVATGLFVGFLYYTRTGLAVRATAQNKEYAGLMGVDVKRISMLVYALYAGLTGTGVTSDARDRKARSRRPRADQGVTGVSAQRGFRAGRRDRGRASALIGEGRLPHSDRRPLPCAGSGIRAASKTS